MEKFIRAVDAISEYSGRWVSWIVYVGIIMLSLEVVLRYVFNSPTVWAHGYTQRLYGSYFVLIGAYTFIHKGHVRVDLLYERVSQKGKAVLDIINCAFLLVWSGVLVPVSIAFFLKSYNMNEVDEMVLAHPIWWVKFMIIIGMLLISLQGLAEVMKSILVITGTKSSSGNIEGRKA
ncbi:MAG: Tripartite ATP-independent periplasmic transporter [Smithella sp. PtaU1.Bin162]|nr:MAG: Tripartite ATP-independent periplasmic transporter [Smithella sp. PtaU1.Bin162]